MVPPVRGHCFQVSSGHQGPLNVFEGQFLLQHGASWPLLFLPMWYAWVHVQMSIKCALSGTLLWVSGRVAQCTMACVRTCGMGPLYGLLFRLLRSCEVWFGNIVSTGERMRVSGIEVEQCLRPSHGSCMWRFMSSDILASKKLSMLTLVSLLVAQIGGWLLVPWLW